MSNQTGAEQAADIVALLRARNPLLWIVSREEARVEGYVMEAAAAAGYVPYFWDVGQGVTKPDGTVSPMGSPDPGETLRMISDRAKSGRERAVWVMRDIAPWLAGPIGMTTCRQLKNLARTLPTTRRESAQAIIVVGPSADVPPELANHATVIEWALPDRGEIGRILDAAINSLPEEMQATAAPNGTREAAIDAAVGLSGEEAAACYARSLVQLRRIDPPIVAREKKRVIARERVLEWFDPLPGGLDAVGGLDVLKTWLVSRKQAYSPAARAYGLPAPRGTLIAGIAGTGKSLTCKAVATAWGVPLLRLDLGALKSKFVGESEGNLRRALRVVEAIGRCVVWIDELEKSMAGATQGAADGGVSSDALGAILSWMQERTGDGFIIATCNDASILPPELIRRFDTVWWVDLPTYIERHQILQAALRAHGRGDFAAREDAMAEAEWDALAIATDGFTGAEIASLVPDALFTGFADGAREITADDLLLAARKVVPLAKTSSEKIDALRSWAAGRARPATTPEETSTQARVATRSIDF